MGRLRLYYQVVFVDEAGYDHKRGGQQGHRQAPLVVGEGGQQERHQQQ